MSLSACIVCGHQVSRQAEACPSCGHGYPGLRATCSSCGDHRISVGTQGFKAGAAAGGFLLAGPVGALIGAAGSGEMRFNCARCGHSWKPTQEEVIRGFYDNDEAEELLTVHGLKQEKAEAESSKSGFGCLAIIAVGLMIGSITGSFGLWGILWFIVGGFVLIAALANRSDKSVEQREIEERYRQATVRGADELPSDAVDH